MISKKAKLLKKLYIYFLSNIIVMLLLVVSCMYYATHFITKNNDLQMLLVCILVAIVMFSVYLFRRQLDRLGISKKEFQSYFFKRKKTIIIYIALISSVVIRFFI